MPISSTETPMINPNMKFKKQQIGVVNPPEVYRYSLRDELQRGDEYYRNFLKSVEKKKRAKLTEKHPTLAHNIAGIIKTISLIGIGYCGIRYRHSIPLIKSICKKPTNPPPNFKADIKKLFGIK